MKRNKFFMLGIVTVLVAVLSLTFVSNTFAKYTSKVTGTDSARVAKWAWSFSDNAVAGDEWKFFENAAYELDPITGNVTSTNDAEVVDKDGTTVLVAPGTGGYAGFTVTNESEVTGSYEITFTATEADVPLQWSIDNEHWEDDITDITAIVGQLNAGETSLDIQLYWKWDFSVDDATDNSDTSLGEAGTAEPAVSIKVVFTQVD